MDYAIPLWEPPGIPVTGTTARFPVRRIYCVGRNYAEHAREMGGDPEREPPFFFMKPADAVLPLGGAVRYAPQTRDLQHEIVLVAAIGRDGRDIPVGSALDHVFGYAVGLDLTRRDLQAELKAKGRPWEMGKAFDQSAPVGAIHPVAKVGHPHQGAIWLEVNGSERQRGDLASMVWSVAEILANLSRYGSLRAGDLVFTGTPAGVGPVAPGDVLRGGIDGLGELTVQILEPP
jgi:fumarylpyruvate hydrolase